jgi:hypothetical protein
LSVIGTAALPALPSSWHLAGTADMNGDGKSDILWQNSDGQVALWEMNGTSIASAVSFGNPGAAWQLQGTGDLNGDGQGDLLFLNPLTHQTENWLLNRTQIVSMQTPVSGGLAAPQSAPPGVSATLIYYPATLLTAASADAQRMVGGSGQIGILTGTDSGATGPVLARS